MTQPNFSAWAKIQEAEGWALSRRYFILREPLSIQRRNGANASTKDDLALLIYSHSDRPGTRFLNVCGPPSSFSLCNNSKSLSLWRVGNQWVRRLQTPLPFSHTRALTLTRSLALSSRFLSYAHTARSLFLSHSLSVEPPPPPLQLFNRRIHMADLVFLYPDTSEGELPPFPSSTTHTHTHTPLLKSKQNKNTDWIPMISVDIWSDGSRDWS